VSFGKWSHELRRAISHYTRPTTKTKVAKVGAKLITIGTADLKRICYTTRTLLEWQTEHFIRTASYKGLK